MEQIILHIAVAVISYLLGSVNTSILVSKKAINDDIRRHGSGNAGLTNSYRTMGGKWSVVVLLGDFAKGIIAALIGAMLLGPEGKLIAGVFVLLGHIFPVFFGFRGGKGVLTSAAMAFVLNPWIFVIVIAVFVAAVVLTKYISLGSILAAAAFPVCVHIFYHDAKFTLLALLIAAMIISKHHANIYRLFTGTESKFKFKKTEEAAR